LPGGSSHPVGETPPSTSGGTPNATPLLRGEGLFSETIDYSRINISRDPSTLESLARRLSKIGALVEQALGEAQDIEGVVIQDKLYLVQTRPQQGLLNRS